MSEAIYETLLYPKTIKFLKAAPPSAHNVQRHTDIPALEAEPCDQMIDKRALHGWRQFQHFLASCMSLKKTFQVDLNQAQQKSWRVLDDWWHGRYHSTTPRRNYVSLLDPLTTSEAVHQVQRVTDRETSYEETLAYLFVVEMLRYPRWREENSQARLSLRKGLHEEHGDNWMEYEIRQASHRRCVSQSGR